MDIRRLFDLTGPLDRVLEMLVEALTVAGPEYRLVTFTPPTLNVTLTLVVLKLPPAGVAPTVTLSTGWSMGGTFTRTRSMTFDRPRFGMAIVPSRLDTVE